MNWTPQKATNLECELIGIILANPDTINEVVSKISTKKFTNQNTKKLFEMLVKSYNSFGKIQRVQVISHLEDLPEEYSQQILEKRFDSFDLQDIIERVKDNWSRSELEKTLGEIAEATRNGLTTQDLLSLAEDRVFAISKEERNGQQPVLSLNDGPLMDSYQSYIDRLDGKATDAGLLTGFRSLDRHLFGLQRGTLTIIGAATSTGKSNFVCQLTNNVIKKDKKVLFVSLEMRKKQIVDRLVIMNSQLNAKEFSTHPKEQNKDAVCAGYGDLHNAGTNLFLSDERNLNALEIQSIARQIKAQEGLDLIVIDYLQNISIPPVKEGMNYAKSVALVLKQIFNMALDLDTPIILVSQLNRGFANRKERTPRLSDLRDSGEIEETADNVILLHNETATVEKTLWREEPEEVEVIIEKARGAVTGAVTFTYNPVTLLFEDPLNNDDLSQRRQQYA